MITGDAPMTLTPADVWQLLKDRFSVSEVAYLAGVSELVASGMVAEALQVPRGTREFPYGLEQEA